MSYTAPLFIGALIPAILLRQFARLILKHWLAGYPLLLTANTASFFIVAALGSIGFADGGQLAFGYAVTLYGPAQLLVLVFDVVAQLRQSQVDQTQKKAK